SPRTSRPASVPTTSATPTPPTSPSASSKAPSPTTSTPTSSRPTHRPQSPTPSRWPSRASATPARPPPASTRCTPPSSSTFPSSTSSESPDGHRERRQEEPHLRHGAAATSVDGGCDWSCRVGGGCLLGCEGEFVLDGGELAEAALASAAVVGVLDPADDLVAELGSGPPDSPAVQHVLLEQGEERLHRCVVPGRGDPAHRPGELRGGEHGPETP